MRRSQTELRNDFLRLSEVFVHVRNEELAQAKRSGLDESSLIPTTNELLEMFDGGVHPRSKILQGLEEALSDFSHELQLGLQDDHPEASRFLKHYQEQTGRDFFQDSVDPHKILRKALKRGRIKGEHEFRIVHNLLNDDLVKPSDLSTISAMLEKFEQDTENDH